MIVLNKGQIETSRCKYIVAEGLGKKTAMVAVLGWKNEKQTFDVEFVQISSVTKYGPKRRADCTVETHKPVRKSREHSLEWGIGSLERRI